MRIRNWKKFQHYNKRKPPWIKFYRELLDDIEVFTMPGDAFKTLALCWLVASEGENGELPDSQVLAFRLRLERSVLDHHISLLGKWIEFDASEVLAGCKQGATLETEKEVEKEAEAEKKKEDEKPKRSKYSDEFQTAWESFGRYGAKAKAWTYWKRINADDRAAIVAAIPEYMECVEAGRTQKQFEGWINPANKAWAMDWSRDLEMRTKPIPARKVEDAYHNSDRKSLLG